MLAINYAELKSISSGSCAGFAVQIFVKAVTKSVANGGNGCSTRNGDKFIQLMKTRNTYKI